MRPDFSIQSCHLLVNVDSPNSAAISLPPMCFDRTSCQWASSLMMIDPINLPPVLLLFY
jgi:hypothetical protein